MNDRSAPDPVEGRLRSNLRAAGIQVDEADIEGVVEKGFLDNVIAFENINAPNDTIPDYLGAWGLTGKSEQAPPASVTGPPASRHLGHARDGIHNSGRGSGDDLRYLSITDIAGLVRSGDVSPVELTERVLARIAEHDPTLNAFQLVLGERALQSARRVEREILDGRYRGPLHGVPVAVKDLMAMRGTPTTAGSKLLADRPLDFDATGVKRLRDAGAIIVGKTRMSEFAYIPGSANAHYGPTRNPWNLEHDSGGSSSGSGAAVADGLVYGALGTDTGGSIRMPAALCGIVGFKPTFGRISLHGVVPLAWSLDHLGPMTRTVADASLMLRTLAGPDPEDIRTRHVSGPLEPVDLDVSIAGLRVGVLRDDGSGEPLGTPEVLAAWQAGLAALERNGARLVEVNMPQMDNLRVLNNAILAMEAATYHKPWLREQLGGYGEYTRQRVLSGFAYGPEAFVHAQQARIAIRRTFDSLLDTVDLLSTPTMPFGAPLLGTLAVTRFTNPFDNLGWPAITVPVGLTSGRLPIGLQLAGKPWGEATVLRAARVVEASATLAGERPR